jgi:hypothetical protein
MIDRSTITGPRVVPGVRVTLVKPGTGNYQTMLLAEGTQTLGRAAGAGLFASIANRGMGADVAAVPRGAAGLRVNIAADYDMRTRW